MKKIQFMDTSFRDGFQSFFGARVLTSDIIPAIEAAAHAGVQHFEAGGGARFQSLPLYCGESAFDMMDAFRSAAGPNAKLQTLARGINVVALQAQPKDMIDLHAKMFKKHGMTHIRNFDALNDVQNLEFSAECITKHGLHHQVCITMMELPPGCEGAHDVDFYIMTLRRILDSGLPFDSLCFKDASGTSNPRKVHDTIAETRKILGPDKTIWFHTHATAGIGELQNMAAIEAGADGICVSRSPVSGGTAQVDLLTMNHALKGTNFTLDIDYRKILEANSVFKDCLKDYFFPPEALKISPEVILSPMPGGALTANTMMMRDTGTLHLYPQVIEEMSEVVKKGGFGTSVTPMSQFYFQQAFSNVTQGRWSNITDGYGKTVLGYFGKTPVAPDAEVVKIASEQLKLKTFSGNPLDLIAPGIPKAEAILKENKLDICEENIFTIGALQTPGGNKGLDFLLGNAKTSVRKNIEESIPSASRPKPSSAGPENYTVTVDGRNYSVTVAEGDVVTSVASAPPIAGGEQIKAKLPGNVLSVLVGVGDSVKKGDKLLVLEAMKMETPVLAAADGVISQVLVSSGDTVTAGRPLIVLE
ncbi:MAG: hypothetical protein KAG61_00725 [Bacteriovoracaceae bacterium]|nr:hypothetical protein [Bacteriovoracaceae bacterium]